MFLLKSTLFQNKAWNGSWGLFVYNYTVILFHSAVILSISVKSTDDVYSNSGER